MTVNDYEHTLEVSIYTEQLKVDFFKAYGNAYEEISDIDNWLGQYTVKAIMCTFGALASGIGLALVTLATKIATLGEIAFKCVANLFEGKFEYSGKYFIAFLFATADLVIGGPLHMIYNLVVDTLGLAISPQDYSKSRRFWHIGAVNLLNRAKSFSNAQQQVVTWKDFVDPKADTVWDVAVLHLKEGPMSFRAGLGCLFNNLIYGNYISWMQLNLTSTDRGF